MLVQCHILYSWKNCLR
ncbi:hypothetical protein MTR67_007954 [Solanum verrucosum]|uniref:Uncharacterized protein n=1 Tax=Solanum verrucosum TaxID=315347 RepID=A0AAF0Q722_SOLVR|nr:hypothetical protein MTR67_007954 [Solanum verrucosum]